MEFDYKFWIGCGLTLWGIYYSWRQLDLAERGNGMNRPLTRYWPTILTVVLIGSVWGIYFIGPSVADIPEYDDKSAGIFMQYNVELDGCSLIANGDTLMRYKSAYRVAAACLRYDGNGDLADKTAWIGQQHDVLPGPVNLSFKINFAPPLIKGDDVRFYILLVPLVS
jgi:hypothetical protein